MTWTKLLPSCFFFVTIFFLCLWDNLIFCCLPVPSFYHVQTWFVFYVFPQCLSFCFSNASILAFVLTLFPSNSLQICSSSWFSARSSSLFSTAREFSDNTPLKNKAIFVANVSKQNGSFKFFGHEARHSASNPSNKICNAVVMRFIP